MTLAYLIDTDWAIHYLRGRRDIVQRLQQLDHDSLAMSVITLAELYTGAFRSRDAEAAVARLEDFLAPMTVLIVEESVARRFGEINAKLLRQNQTIGDFDLMIGCTALEYDLVLLSNNRRHFERIAGLQIESI